MLAIRTRARPNRFDLRGLLDVFFHLAVADVNRPMGKRRDVGFVRDQHDGIARLMEPREDKVKLPSDMAGVTTVTYKKGADGRPDIGAACNKLRRLFEQGPR